MTVYEQIMQVANCDIETAKKIRDAIDRDWALDWSECTQSQFERAVRRYLARVQANCRHAFLEERAMGDEYFCLDCGIEVEGN